jgi:protein-tyrosine phosphatase
VIDTHNHLLAGVDDGARDTSEMLEMCRVASADGIERVVATPHSLDGRYINEPASIRGLVLDLNERLDAAGLGLQVDPGMEVRVSPELFDSLDNSMILPLNEGRYVLLELHPLHFPAGFENLVRRFLDRGLRIILAHPEKNFAIQRNPELLFKLIGLFKPWELLIQVTAASILRRNGFLVSRLTRLLVKSNLAHLIATDAHDPTSRAPTLSKAVEVVARLAGEEKAAQMTRDIPQAVLDGKKFPEVWEPVNPHRWWRVF